MIIGLDWDNTFTRDTEFWQQFINNARFGCHAVYIVTSRDMDTPIEFIPDGVSGVVYCKYRAKQKVIEEQGIKIDIWIDDDPEFITGGFID